MKQQHSAAIGCGQHIGLPAWLVACLQHDCAALGAFTTSTGHKAMHHCIPRGGASQAWHSSACWLHR